MLSHCIPGMGGLRESHHTPRRAHAHIRARPLGETRMGKPIVTYNRFQATEYRADDVNGIRSAMSLLANVLKENPQNLIVESVKTA